MKTYTVNAWCVRPFIATLEVKAETPEEAVATGRTQQQQLLDAAEECNGQYPWDEFAAYDGHGKEALRVLDPAARLRASAPAMRDTLLYVAQELSAFKPDFLRQLGLDVALEQVEIALASADNTLAQETAT